MIRQGGSILEQPRGAAQFRARRRGERDARFSATGNRRHQGGWRRFMTETEAEAKPSRLRQIPGGIWALGFVSLLMDVSSEMIHALLPVYLVTVLGASMTSVGAIEGIAESTASIVKIFSGALSDWLGTAQIPGDAGLWPRRADEARLSARAGDRRALRGALRRPRGQGHTRRPARRPRGRHRSAGPARRQLRPAPVPRHRRRLSGAGVWRSA